jgi:hypothetical protein
MGTVEPLRSLKQSMSCERHTSIGRAMSACQDAPTRVRTGDDMSGDASLGMFTPEEQFWLGQFTLAMTRRGEEEIVAIRHEPCEIIYVPTVITDEWLTWLPDYLIWALDHRNTCPHHRIELIPIHPPGKRST